MNYSLNAYLEKNHKEEIKVAAQKLLDEDNVRELPAHIVDVYIYQIDTSNLLKTKDFASFPIQIEATIQSDDGCRIFRQTVRMLGEMKGTFSRLFSDFKIKLHVIKPIQMKKARQKYTESLLPEYQKEKLEEIASDILEMSYPFYNMYHNPARVDPIDMAKRWELRCIMLICRKAEQFVGSMYLSKQMLKSIIRIRIYINL